MKVSTHEFAGMRVRANPHLSRIPAIELRDSVPVSDAFRESFNAWALETFGTKPAVVKVGSGTIVVDPETFAELQGMK